MFVRRLWCKNLLQTRSNIGNICRICLLSCPTNVRDWASYGAANSWHDGAWAAINGST